MYVSWKLKDHEKKYLTHALKLATIVFALKLWQNYLYGKACEIYTDYKNLSIHLEES